MSDFESNHNPFHYGDAFDTNDLVDRKDEITCVENAIRDGARLFLAGLRGVGKTSILRTAQQNMIRKGAIVLYVNIEATPDIGELIEEIVRAALEQGLKMRDPALLDFSANKHEQIARLARALNALDRAAGAQEGGREVALIIDEFSALMARFGVTAEGQIRAEVQTHQNLGYIFSGSDVQLMMDMTGNYSRPFYRGGTNLYLRPLDKLADQKLPAKDAGQS